MRDEFLDEIVALCLKVPGTSETFARRVLSKIHIEHPSGCWWWQAACNFGYGVIGRGGRADGLTQAHRAVYELLVGPIPVGLVWDHLCRNPPCVNPDHGELVTLAENKRRGYSPARMHAMSDLCKYGHPKDGWHQPRNKPGYRTCGTCVSSKRKPKIVKIGMQEEVGPLSPCHRAKVLIMANLQGREPGDLLTPGEVGRMLHVDAKTVTRWAAGGKLRSIRTLGGHRRMFWEDIEAILRGEEPRTSNDAGLSGR